MGKRPTALRTLHLLEQAAAEIYRSPLMGKQWRQQYITAGMGSPPI